MTKNKPNRCRPAARFERQRQSSITPELLFALLFAEIAALAISSLALGSAGAWISPDRVERVKGETYLISRSTTHHTEVEKINSEKSTEKEDSATGGILQAGPLRRDNGEADSKVHEGPVYGEGYRIVSFFRALPKGHPYSSELESFIHYLHESY